MVRVELSIVVAVQTTEAIHRSMEFRLLVTIIIITAIRVLPVALATVGMDRTVTSSIATETIRGLPTGVIADKRAATVRRAQDASPPTTDTKVNLVAIPTLNA